MNIAVRGFGLTVDQLAPGVVRIALEGELDVSRHLLVDQEIRSAEASGPAAIVLDLRNLAFMDSTGLARMLSAKRRAARGGWRLLVVRGNEVIDRLLALTGADRAFELIDQPSDALLSAPRTRDQAGLGAPSPPNSSG